jgi:hypothetical protein
MLIERVRERPSPLQRSRGLPLIGMKPPALDFVQDAVISSGAFDPWPNRRVCLSKRPWPQWLAL